jgi:predicted acetyltransferase
MSTLKTPSVQYRESFLAAAGEFLAEGRLDSTYAICLGYTVDRLSELFPRFVLDLKSLADAECSGAQYPDRIFWLVDGDEYIGQSSIRPELSTSYLLTYGGHIGYSIRPSRRRLGYGKTILALILDAAGEMGLKRVLVTCDSDNIGSRKIIEHNGGQFESAMSMTSRTFRAEGRKSSKRIDKLRYWIDLG